MRFEFATATRIIFGPGGISEAVGAATGFGKCALIVTGRSSERATPLIDQLGGRNIASATFAITGEPTVSVINDGVTCARSGKCDIIIGFGGGSVIDAGKAIAALLANGGDVLDYLEVVGRGKTLERPSIPFIAIPTTAGTGAEVTRNAVITVPDHGIKVSLRSPLMLPRLAVIDPHLTCTLPADVTASTGLDALTQCIEAYVCVTANALTDGFAREGMTRAARSLRIACADGADAAAREDMALASLMSGLALANAGLGAVHGFAAVIGGKCGAPHGAVCALLLPHVMEVTIRALRERGNNPDALQRYAVVAGLLTGNPSASAGEGVAWIASLSAGLPLPPPSSIGLQRQAFTETAASARKASSMKGNPIELTDEELQKILERAFTGG